MDSYTAWIEQCRKKPILFPQIVESDFKNIRRIHPLKQRLVDEIYRATKDLTDVHIWVFGSSVSDRCGIHSDLDLAVKASFAMRGIIDNVVFGITNGFSDIVWVEDLSPDSQLYANIWKDGVLLL